MEDSKIEWTDNTFNPWEGCTKVSPGCAHCYAEARNARFGGGTAGNWGKGAPRRRTSVQNWNGPRKWDRQYADDLAAFNQEVQRSYGHLDDMMEAPRRPRVFCASLADVGDMEVPIEWFADLLQLIFECQNLDWQLLTKRPETFRQRLMHAALYMAGYRDGQTSENPTAKPMAGWEWAHDWAVVGKPPANVWMGTTVEDQRDDRIAALLALPARVRFLSCEPLLSAVNLRNVKVGFNHGIVGIRADHDHLDALRCGIDWVICGGESGPSARPMHPDWARSLRDQCKATGVPFLFKQWGEHIAEVVKGTAPDLRALAPNQSVAWGDGKTNHVLYTRVGKKAAGRLLDGIEHNGMPEVAR